MNASIEDEVRAALRLASDDDLHGPVASSVLALVRRSRESPDFAFEQQWAVRWPDSDTLTLYNKMGRALTAEQAALIAEAGGINGRGGTVVTRVEIRTSAVSDWTEV